MIQHHPRHLYIWTSPDLKTRNQTDYMMFKPKCKSSVKNARTRPGADCNGDHQMLTADIKFKLKRLKRLSPPMRLDYETLDGEYRVKIANRFETLIRCEEEKTPNELWESGKEILLKSTKWTICKRRKKHADWI